MRARSPSRSAFTIIELLVVISIITLLISIALPHLMRSKYESRITICLSNFHQFGNATLSYAGDNREALPRQDETFTTGVNSWDVSNRFPVEIGKYGVNDHRMWDCPVSPLMPPTVTDWTQAKAHFNSAYSHFSIVPYNWWVPRKFGAVWFPSPAADPTCEPGEWPTHVSSPGADKKPIMSDRVSQPTGQPANVLQTQGGHRWAGMLESSTVVYTDAHAERRPAQAIQRRYSGNWQNFY